MFLSGKVSMIRCGLTLSLLGATLFLAGCGGRDIQNEAREQALIDIEKARIIDSLATVQERDDRVGRARLAIETMELNVSDQLGFNLLTLEMNNIQPYSFELALRCLSGGKTKSYFIDVPARTEVDTESLRFFKPGDSCELMYEGQVFRSYTFPVPNPLADDGM